ncbi:MAG: GGDEF domain-containing protein [Alphaproteobacteria bacterium]|nr:GGDEF domain-containing protein [Alphaproteobacteria bacterium]
MPKKTRREAETHAVEVKELIAETERLQALNADLERELVARTNELIAANEELRRLAISDTLTGMHNRRHFCERAAGDLRRWRRHRQPMALVVLDIDDLRLINEDFGHWAGDDVLVAIGQTIHDAVRTTDLVARIGADEFAILLYDTGADGARELSERLREAIEASWISTRTQQVRVTVSVGVAVMEDAIASVEQLLAYAQVGLDAARSGAGNRIVTHLQVVGA